MTALAKIEDEGIPARFDRRENLPGIIARAGQRLLDSRNSAELLEVKHVAEAALHYAKVTQAANDIIANSHHVAALCKHGVASDDERPIDSRYDIGSFQLMMHDAERGFVFTKVFDQPQAWERFVFRWFGVPGEARGLLLETQRADAAA